MCDDQRTGLYSRGKRRCEQGVPPAWSQANGRIEQKHVLLNTAEQRYAAIGKTRKPGDDP